MKPEKTRKDCGCKDKKSCTIDRREFLFASSAVTVMVTLSPGTPEAQETPALVSVYPRKLIGKLSELKQDEPVDFPGRERPGLLLLGAGAAWRGY